MSLGAFPAVNLSDARDLRTEKKGFLAKGIDPIEHEKEISHQKKADAASKFNHIAEDLITKSVKECLPTATLTKKRWFLSLVASDLGHRPIKEIRAVDILRPLRRIEDQGNYETARRLRAFISQVFRYAIATSRAEIDPSYGLQGAFIAPKVEHLAAIFDRKGFRDLI